MKLRSFLFLVLYLIALRGFAQVSEDNIRVYINKYKSIALEQEQEYGIPAPVTLAQGILESAAGTSWLTQHSNNHFGIKRGGSWTGKCVYAWDDEKKPSAFRQYRSAEESYRDHSRILTANSRYAFLFSKSVFDYRGWAHGLQKAGYATSQTYAKALIGYIERYQLYTINGGQRLAPGKTYIKTIRKEVVVIDTIQIESTMEDVSEEENVTNIIRRYLIEVNGVRCTILYPGETLSSVAMKYNIPKSKLLAYNETSDERDIHEGDIVYLEKKKKKYTGAQDYYRVKEDETLHQIAQKFGVRLSSLSKMNDLNIFSDLTEGKSIRLK